jgi:hypothetical protein
MDGFTWDWDGRGWPSLQGMEQLSPSLHLGVGPVPDLPPDGVGRVGVHESLGHDALEVKPLDGREEVLSGSTSTACRASSGLETCYSGRLDRIQSATRRMPARDLLSLTLDPCCSSATSL